MSLLKEYDEIIDKKDKILLAVAIELRAKLVTPAKRGGGSPVDTGYLRASWSPLIKTEDGYRLTNDAIYADIALGGVRIVNGKQYGSEQLPEGLAPIIQKYNEILQQKLKEIK